LRGYGLNYNQRGVIESRRMTSRNTISLLNLCRQGLPQNVT